MLNKESLSAAKKYVWKQVWRKCILMLGCKVFIYFRQKNDWDRNKLNLMLFTFIYKYLLCYHWYLGHLNTNHCVGNEQLFELNSIVSIHTQDQSKHEWQGIYIEYISHLLLTDRSVFCKWSLPNSNCIVGTKLSIEVVCGFLFTTLEFAKSFI